MSKHVDGPNNNRWDNWTLFYNINTIAVASENDNRMLQWQNIALNKKIKCYKKCTTNNDVVILIALI